MFNDALLEKLLIAGWIALCILDLFLPPPYLFIVDVSLGVILVLAEILRQRLRELKIRRSAALAEFASLLGLRPGASA